MANKRSESEHKPDGSLNLSACMRKVLRELGPDCPNEEVATQLKKRYKIEEVPPNLYVIRAEIRKEKGVAKVPGKRGGRPKASTNGESPAKAKASANGVESARLASSNGTDSNVVKAVRLAQEAMALCGSKEAMQQLVECL